LYEQAQAEREGPDPREAAVSSTYAQFDDETFLELYTQPAGEGLREVELYLEGVHCAACVWLVEKIPAMVPGVQESRLQFRRSLLRLVWSPEQTSLSSIAQLLERLGYPPHPYRDLHRHSQHRKEDRRMLIRIALAGACAGNVMLMAFALYSGMFGDMSQDHKQLFRWASLIVALPAVGWSSLPFFRGAWAALKMRSLHMDLPIALGIFAGFGWGAWNTFRQAGEVYFDSVTTLIFFLLVGRWLQVRQQRHAAEATELMYSLSPSTARRISGGEVQEVPVEALHIGESIEVRAGDTIPVDGIIRGGDSRLDLAILTGESRPIPVEEGDTVHAGSINLTSHLLIEVQATGNETRLGQLLREVEEASERRAPIVKLADRIAGSFVAVVLVLALGTLLFWLWRSPEHALEHAVALLIVTCPCALGMATPLAIIAGLGKAARHGILIKGGDILEAIATPSRLWLDKTGTITQGKMALVSWHGDTSIQPMVHAIESQSAHPIAKALVEGLPAPDSPIDVTIEQLLGKGLRATIDQQEYVIGSPAFVQQQVHLVPDWVEEQVHTATQQALTPVLFALDGEIVACAGLGDPIREDAAETLRALRELGWKVGILSGDHPEVVQAVARQLGLPEEDCHGGLSPEQKQQRLEAEQGASVMVGDGVNDAAALATATVGVSVHGGAEASLAIADVYLSKEGLSGLHQLILGAHMTTNVIKRNFMFSIGYNIVGATLAMMGLLNPLLAAILMPLSSLTVISHSFRAKTF
jgi:Cu2+-exporting ATPase